MSSLDATQVLMMPWVVPVVFGCLVAMVAIVSNVAAGCISGIAETRLKRSMVERGYSPEEIERVVRVSSASSDVETLPAKPPRATKGSPAY